MIPVWELISFWDCLGKRRVMLSKTFLCFLCPGLGEAKLPKVYRDIPYHHFCPHPGPHGRRRELKISGVGLWPVIGHWEVMLQFDNLLQCVKKTGTLWKLRQHWCLHLLWVVFAKTLACFTIGICELIHLSFIYLIQIFQIWYMHKSKPQNAHIKFDVCTDIVKIDICKYISI